jgi:hypothetical protein
VTFNKIRWKLPQKPTIVADAAFDKEEVRAKLEAWGGTATLSVSSDNSAWLWNTLKHTVPPKNWRAVVDSNNWIASIHTIVDPKQSIVTQQLLSNAFKAVVYAGATSAPVLTPNLNNSNSGNNLFFSINCFRYNANIHSCNSNKNEGICLENPVYKIQHQARYENFAIFYENFTYF